MDKDNKQSERCVYHIHSKRHNTHDTRSSDLPFLLSVEPNEQRVCSIMSAALLECRALNSFSCVDGKVQYSRGARHFDDRAAKVVSIVFLEAHHGTRTNVSAGMREISLPRMIESFFLPVLRPLQHWYICLSAISYECCA